MEPVTGDAFDVSEFKSRAERVRTAGAPHDALHDRRGDQTVKYSALVTLRGDLKCFSARRHRTLGNLLTHLYLRHSCVRSTHAMVPPAWTSPTHVALLRSG